MSRPLLILLLLAVSAGVMARTSGAVSTPWFSDEAKGSIPLAEGISFSIVDPELPLRGRNHPALVGYVVKASRSAFGTSPLGTRALHLLAGFVTIGVVFLMARNSFGPAAGLWAAALLAMNEYHAGISSIATSHAPHLLFVTLAMYAFHRFLRAPQAIWLYAAAVGVAGAFWCKEHSVLLLPVFLLALMHPSTRHWLRGRHPWAAAALFALLISPDVLANVRATDAVTYSDHLDRIGGFGFSQYPLAFYARGLVTDLQLAIAGTPFEDGVEEYASMNSLMGIVLLVCVAVAAFRPNRDAQTSPVGRWLILQFVIVFGFFFFIRPGAPERDLDPVSWVWVDMTLLPAVLLASSVLSQSDAGRIADVARFGAAAAMVWAGGWMFL